MLRKVYFIFFFILIGEIFAIISANFVKTYRQEVKIKDIEESINYDNSIYLFGDSYTVGYGISNEDKISSILKDINYYNVYDKSKGGYHWIDYLDIIADNQNFFKEGDLLVLMVNWNDVLYNQNDFNRFFKKSHKDSSTSETSLQGHKRSKIKRSKLKKLILKIYSTSKLANFISGNIQNFIRRNGILLPIGDFYYLSEIAYDQKESDMEKIISTLDYVALSKKVDIIIYLHPNYNLLSYPKYLKKFVAAFKDKGFSSLKIIDGVNQFKNKKDGYYCLSIHDGHPNGNAHRIIADTLKNFISVKY